MAWTFRRTATAEQLAKRGARQSAWLSRGRALLFWTIAVALGIGLIRAWETSNPFEVLGYALAALPGLISLANFVYGAPRRFEVHKASLTRLRLPPGFDIRYPAFTLTSEELDRYAPRFLYMLFAAAILTGTFAASVVISRSVINPHTLTKSPTSLATATTLVADKSAPTPTATPTSIATNASVLTPTQSSPQALSAPVPAGKVNQTSTIEHDGTTATPTPTTTPTHDPARGPTRAEFCGDEPRYGFIFASAGAYIQTLFLTVSRINSTALTTAFVINSAIRVVVAAGLGFLAGQLSLFAPLATDNQLWFIYFAVGLFPMWALQWLRERIRAMFARNEQGCDTLPLCLIEGLDDGIVERLAEIGHWDIQHLMTANPIDVSMRTLYPLTRVLDWIHQAILIGFVRQKIVIFRSLGIRGALDFAALYADMTDQFPRDPEQSDTRKKRADDLLTALAQKAEISKEALMAIGRLLLNDNGVCLISEITTGFSQSPFANVMFESIKKMVRNAAVDAALHSTLPFLFFDPDPPANEPLRLPTARSFEIDFAGKLDELLLPIGVRWSGSFARVRAATDWGIITAVVMGDLQAI